MTTVGPTTGDVDWRTPAERADFRATPDYAETMDYVGRLEAAYPGSIRTETFGRTGEGRDLRVVIVSRDGEFEPERVHASGRAVLLVQNCIHAGETDGKDACLALVRDLHRDAGLSPLLRNVALLVVPIYNADGHERRSAHTRFNQNGPEIAGWRANGTNLNLNRDYMKADAPETAAFFRLLRRWSPDFFVDDHVTDGMDFQYDVTFQLDDSPEVFPAHAEWFRSTVTPEIERHVNDAGHLAFPTCVFLKDDSDPAQGLAFQQTAPRFSTGRMMLENRPGLLVEMHMLKDYATRVAGNYETLHGLLKVLDRHARKLKELNRDADRAAAALSTDGRPVPLVLVPTGETTPVRFRGVAYSRVPSEVSGTEWVRYGSTPVELTLPIQTGLRAAASVTPPAGYLIPPSWMRVIEVLEIQGVETAKTTRRWVGEIERYRFSATTWPARPFEGRHPVLLTSNVEREFGSLGPVSTARERAEFPAGSTLVPLAQRRSKVAIHWLEPEAPDSAVRWGFFGSIFEQKEVGEGYVLEKFARSEMARDPTLRTDFEGRLRVDPEFARSPTARLEFFYRRSPWFTAQRVGEYPVGRLLDLEGIPTS
jgi:hypothetical protein